MRLYAPACTQNVITSVMASTNDEFWTLETNHLLVDQRIAKDSVFRTSNSDQNGWLEILDVLRKAGAPKSLNRVHVRRQWTKICEEYKKIAEISITSIEELNVPYYAKLKEFFEKQFAQNEQKFHVNNEDDNKLLTTTLLKENSFRQCYADRWSVHRTNLLIDTRIAKNDFFKGRGHTSAAWQIVLAEMLLLGEPETLTVPQIKKKWDNLITRYQEILKTKSSKIHDWPYFEKLHDFMTSKHIKSSDELTSDFISADVDINEVLVKNEDFDITTLPTDRWTLENTNLLIDTRIARNSDFINNECSEGAWQNVLNDMSLEETQHLTIERLKNKWDSLKNKYYSLDKSNTNKKNEWVYYEKLHNFLQAKNNIIADDLTDKHCDIFKWTNPTIDLLIKIIIQKNNSSEEWNEACWQSVLSTMQESVDTKSLNVSQIEKKWNSLYDKYAMIQKSKKPSHWTHYKILNSFFGTKPKSETDQNYVLKNKCYADRWPTKRIKLLIKKRIAREPMFDGRKLSSVGWNAILHDMRAAGTPQNVTIPQIKKKWENLCRKYKMIKDNSNYNKSWPLFKEMDEYFKMKDVKIEEYVESPEKPVIEEKNTKCRLCQEQDIEYNLEDNKELCGKISECLSINVFENMDLLPNGICKKCQISIDAFYPFLIHCQNVDKQLHEQLSLTAHPDIKVETCMMEDESVSVNYPEVQSSFECSECPVVFNTNKSLEAHLKSHCSSSSRYFCDMCNSSFSRQSALYSHIKTHFEMENMLVVIPENQDEPSVEDAKVETEMETVAGTTCIVCRKAFPSRRALREHLQTHSRTMLKCPREGCNKTYASFKSLENHEMKHLGLKSFLCVVCGKGFVTKNALQTHEKIHLDVKEYECTICSVRFAVASNLRAHQKKHHEGVRFYCSQCPKEFLSKDSLNRHEIAHTGIKDFICDICSAAFYTAKELRKHKFYHDGTRMHHCNLCFKTFYEKHHLTVHMRSHTDERPYPCKITGCGKAFRESQKLRRHMKQQHRLQS